MKNEVKISVRINREIYEQYKRLLETDGLTVSSDIRQHINKLIKKEVKTKLHA